MTAVLDDATADPWQIIADLQRKLDASIAELAQRNSEYGERIEQQSATIDVLKVMSASPGDPQPVFDLIVRRAQELCNGWDKAPGRATKCGNFIRDLIASAAARAHSSSRRRSRAASQPLNYGAFRPTHAHTL
jgi:hypothetical protein